MPNLTIEPNEHVTYKVWHEDEHLLVIGKPAKIVTAPGKGHDANSLLNGLFARHGTTLQNLGKTRDFGLLHRLDKMTSGLMVVALSTKAYDGLRAAFEKREVAKFYWALVQKAPKKPEGTILGTIAEYTGTAPAERTGKNESNTAKDKKLARVSSAGQPAKTLYRVLQTVPTGATPAGAIASLVECRAFTGRLHQVRVHLESIGCPILGDDFYAPLGARQAAPRLALHAHRLVFTHPVTRARIDVRSPWPDDLRATLKKLGIEKPAVPKGPAGLDA